jgi:hypothetical protein
MPVDRTINKCIKAGATSREMRDNRLLRASFRNTSQLFDDSKNAARIHTLEELSNLGACRRADQAT